ncbi:MAG: hypothetical protein Q9167_003862 [Letrouitia subvulpina]
MLNATASAPLSELMAIYPTRTTENIAKLELREGPRGKGHHFTRHHGPHHHPKHDQATPHPVPHSSIQQRTLSVRQDGGYESFVIGGFNQPTTSSLSTSAATIIPSSICPGNDGIVFQSVSGITYQTVCGLNFEDNIMPFLSVDSFESCIQKCDAYNYDNHRVECVAALFVPSRINNEDDCYLKSSVDNSSPNEGTVVGAVRYKVAQSASFTAVTTVATTSQVQPSSSTSAVSSISSASLSEVKTSYASPSSNSTTISQSSSAAAQTLSQPTIPQPSTAPQPGATFGLGKSIVVPQVGGSKLHGPSENRPTSQYIEFEHPDGYQLPQSLLQVGVNGDLTTNYDISPQTGVLEVNENTQSILAPLREVPHLSRDGGRGGFVNGQHLFTFCDSGSYSTTTFAQDGDFLAFVSSSVAVDVGMNGLAGNPIFLQDGIGEWSDNVGRQRGFAPMTQGEQAYNIVMQGKGQRYAVWPESSIIPLDGKRGLIYAPIIYDNVNMVTKAAVFTYTGATLLEITAGGRGGPIANRTVRKLFNQDEVEWGCAGGLRSWGPSGYGGDDGKVYVFGAVSGGLLLGRTTPDAAADRDSYEYWTGSSWSNSMPSSTSAAYFLKAPIMDVDVFYSPRHLTFIAVYLTIYADNVFYYRYLKADTAILPPFAPGGDKNSDYVENLLKYEWSDEQVLYKAKPGLGGKYIYSGGVHLGYFGSNDISNGGSRILLSWTAPTGKEPSTVTSEYQIITAEVNLA